MTAKEKEVAVPKTNAAVVTTNPKKKEVKPIKEKEKPTNIKIIEADFDTISFNAGPSSFLRNGQVIDLKEVELTQDKLNRNWYAYIIRELMDKLKAKYPENKPKIEHAIVDDVLYVLVGSSKLVLSQTNYFLDLSINLKVTYLDDEGIIPPADGVILFNTTINTPSLHVNGLSSFYDCTFNIKTSMRLEGSNTVNKTSAYNSSYLTIKKSILKDCSFTGDSIEINNTTSTELRLYAKDRIIMKGSGYAPRNNLSITGNIGSIEIDSDCFPYSRQLANISYSGDETIDVITTRRVDNGYFMGIDPIPFIRAFDGILVGNMHFTYAEIRKFYDAITMKMRPINEDRHHSFTSQSFSFGTRDDFGAVYKKIVSVLKGQNHHYSRNKQPTLVSMDEFDPALRIHNEQVLVLTEQINSRLKTFIELDTMRV